MLTAVTRTAHGHHIAVGHDVLVLASADPETGWKVSMCARELDLPLLDIWIADDGTGLAVGAYGLALATQDHGRSWSHRLIDPQESHLYAIREAPDGTLFIAGEFGTVFRSRDRGLRWDPARYRLGRHFFRHAGWVRGTPPAVWARRRDS